MQGAYIVGPTLAVGLCVRLDAARKDVDPVKLEYAEKRLKQSWYDLVMAEQRGASEQALEDLYASYMQALEEYNRCSEAQARQRESQVKRSVSLVQQKKTA